MNSWNNKLHKFYKPWKQNENVRLGSKIAIVTGASSEIGKGIVKRFVDEGANVVLYLASDEANWVTGTILNVDGGKTAAE